MQEERGPRIGVWGTFDLENYGDMLFPWIARVELARRLPGSSIRAFSPVGAGLPNRFVTGEAVEPLGPWDPARLLWLASELDLVVIGGGEIIHDGDPELAPHYGLDPEEAERRAFSRYFLEGLGRELERECPVIWHAVGIPRDLEGERAEELAEILEARPYLSVRDEVSLDRVRAIGVKGEVALVPDPAFLLPRVLPPENLATRRRRLTEEGALPEGPYLTVQGNARSIPLVPAVAEALQGTLADLGAAPVLVETGPIHGDRSFADALERMLPGATRMAGGTLDLAATIASAEGFVGTSLHGSVTAFAYGRPRVILGWGGETKLRGLAELLEAPETWVDEPDDIPVAFGKAAAGGSEEILEGIVDRLDRHFDRIAEVARDLPAAPPAADELERLRAAHEVRGRQLVTLRWGMADVFAGARDEAKRRRAESEAAIEEARRLRDDRGRLEGELHAARQELERLQNTRTFRYTSVLRRLYGRLRRTLRRGG